MAKREMTGRSRHRLEGKIEIGLEEIGRCGLDSSGSG
jgi:hypothetical protein